MATTVTNKNGIEFDIDALATDVNGKMDKDGVNATCPVVISRTPNSYSGVVEIWSDGYCVQSGLLTGDNANVTLDQPYKDTNYLIFCQWNGGKSSTFFPSDQYIINITVNGFTTNGPTHGNVKQRNWRTEGYIR